MNSTKISAGTIARTAVLIAALLNQILTFAGKNPLPFSDDEIYTAITTLATVAASLAAWWKNNSFTTAAIRADKVMKDLKGKDGGRN